MTLSELRSDNRVMEINRVYDEDFKYEIWLNDGWTFDNNSHYEVADTVKELNELMHEVVEEDFTETHPEWFGYDNTARADETEYILQIVYTDEMGKQDIVWSKTTTKKRGINEFMSECPDYVEIVVVEWTPVDALEASNALTIHAICGKYDMTLKAISDRFGIPYRTVQNWSAGVNKCPEYVLGMINEILAKDTAQY